LSFDEYAEVLTANTILCSFKVSDFRKVIQMNPYMALGYANKVSRKLRKLENRHADLVFRDAKARLIHFIKNWARMDGSLINNKIVLPNYLTHSDIAGFISTSRQSVNVLLNELRDSGLLFYNRKKIELNDPRMWN
jgi:CRP/FNR family cyclic AMP-dependent transcriptional regulator